jgi:hypothetical protein
MNWIKDEHQKSQNDAEKRKKWLEDFDREIKEDHRRFKEKLLPYKDRLAKLVSEANTELRTVGASALLSENNSQFEIRSGNTNIRCSKNVAFKLYADEKEGIILSVGEDYKSSHDDRGAKVDSESVRLKDINLSCVNKDDIIKMIGILTGKVKLTYLSSDTSIFNGARAIGIYEMEAALKSHFSHLVKTKIPYKIIVGICAIIVLFYFCSR